MVARPGPLHPRSRRRPGQTQSRITHSLPPHRHPEDHARHRRPPPSPTQQRSPGSANVRVRHANRQPTRPPSIWERRRPRPHPIPEPSTVPVRRSTRSRPRHALTNNSPHRSQRSLRPRRAALRACSPCRRGLPNPFPR